jgi:hypothetical protein
MWARRIGGNHDDLAYAITLDSGWGVYIAGTFNNTVDFDPGPGASTLTSSGYYDAFIVKLDASGNNDWAGAFGGAVSNDVPRAIALDTSANIYVMGTLRGSGGDFDPGPGTYVIVPTNDETDIFISKLSGPAVVPSLPLRNCSILIALSVIGVFVARRRLTA